MRTAVVTGGAGFIGSGFARALAAGTDLHIVVFDKLTYAGSLLNLGSIPPDRLTFVRGDLADAEAVGGLLREYRPTWVVNFAAESHVDRSIDGPRAFVEANINGTFELLEACRTCLLRASSVERAAFRVLHVSTDEVYGSLGPEGAFSEETPYAPNSPYAATKAAADHLARAYAETYGLPVLVTNCSNNYGPYQFPEKLIPLTILNALDGRALPVYGDGKAIRDWLHVDDHCAAILAVLQRGVPGEKYNIGANEERTTIEVVETVCGILDRLAPPALNPAVARQGLASYRDLITFVADRPGHDRRYAIDARKVRRELGWHPEQTFANGLDATVRWYLEHRPWCDAVQRGEDARRRLGLGTAAVANL
jgi:dTDP-glucose 4,6-dehydratase